ncbi:MAG: hypothetical protein K8H88_16160 [Sandaracinaceae bacterium]|nr:hypothetical protein [Sandaracinaceae bacterium]
MTCIRVLLIATLALGAVAHAQDEQAASSQISDGVRAELRRLLGEADAHFEAGRHALAFQGYMALHARMEELGMPRATVALWNAGRALAQVPGREREAREILQRFLDGSTAFANETDVAEFRSAAVARIAELDARIGSANATSVSEPAGPPPPAASASMSPIGPVLLGIGGAALITSFIVGGVALAQGDTLRAECGGVCTEAERPRANDVQLLSGITDALLFGGAAIAVTGLVLTLLLRDGPNPPSSVALACDSSGCAGAWQGTFQ